MSATLPRGIVAISIDLELDPQRRVPNQRRYFEDVAPSLLELLRRYQVCATWGVADPAVSALTDRLTSEGGGHEIAILGDSTWVGLEAGRCRFAREMARRAERARSASLGISSLLLRVPMLNDHFDIAAKAGIRAIGGTIEEASGGWLWRGPATRTEALRFGMCSIPAGLHLPGASRFLPSGGAVRHAKRSIDEAIRKPAVCHMRINGLSLGSRGPAALAALEKVLRHLDRRRTEGVLVVETLAGTSRLLTGGRKRAAARSILRPAA